MYILVHDGGKRNKSLLTQLGVRDQMKFLCSGHQIDDRNLTSSNPLAMMHMRASEDPMFVPILDEHSERYRWSSFGEWWTRDAIFSSGSGKNLVYRKNLVFNLRNKDGGAHYDETLGDIEYQEMVRGGGWMIIKGNLPERAMVDLELVSMRQIAHEVLASIKRAGLA
ncbi:hypothetical protein [Hyphomonas sp.]|uniref:hypothetical protein n=1 Tax=Hyphomonas sp. TaxID=87 RepID=UPI001BCAF204|nr:hypothetical protein [Hyphomonas sp.]